MKDELTFKYSLYKKHIDTFGEKEMCRRLGLKKWESNYFRNKHSQGDFQTNSKR